MLALCSSFLASFGFEVIILIIIKVKSAPASSSLLYFDRKQEQEEDLADPRKRETGLGLIHQIPCFRWGHLHLFSLTLPYGVHCFDWAIIPYFCIYFFYLSSDFPFIFVWLLLRYWMWALNSSSTSSCFSVSFGFERLHLHPRLFLNKVLALSTSLKILNENLSSQEILSYKQ